ncbi:hypothetical protein NKR23_g7423 [Pleurostoma richardsiae]|uniref:Mitochondrial ATPase complex subunit ATP10 n=1 Tax=Pleurostoma richardsiae TaxID=41990 RepID=A0AA38VGV8_9PEZI|nr:hypothetical protein NKR23_g7423 [Pleurostoma richardsiae]
MLERAYRGAGLKAARQPIVTCLFCQWSRPFSATCRRLKDGKTSTPPKEPSKPAQSSDVAAVPQSAPESPLANAPRAYGKRVDDFKPVPLSRPIGMHFPPQAGENTGVDTRSLQQRRDDFVDYEKHLKRREELKQKMAKPYFREWSNLQFQKGKSFLAPPRLFRADKSLYFPNLHGRTLAGTKPGAPLDTTPVLSGAAASVVTVFSSLWAENQTRTFVSPEANPALHETLRVSGGRAQLVRVNFEENAMRYWLVRLFSGSLRRQVGKENWHKYFLIRRGVSEEIRESIGLLNSKVGYTYLVDRECRIRWAGSGPSEPEEREGLVKGVHRLLDEDAKRTTSS